MSQKSITTKYPTTTDTTLQLFISCINNDIPAMKLLIEQKADPNSYCNLYNEDTSKYISPTSTPISSTSDSIVTFIQGDHHNTLLHAAITTNNIQMVQYVINDLGITKFNDLDYAGNDALSIAIQLDYYEITKYLIEQCGVVYRDPSNRFLSRFQSFELFRYLIELKEFDRTEWLSKFDKYVMKIVRQGLLQHFQYIVNQFNYNVNKDQFIFNMLFDSLLVSNNIELFDYFITISKWPLPLHFQNRPLLYGCISRSSWDIFKHLIDKYNVGPGESMSNYETTILHCLLRNPDATIDMVEYCINDLGIDPNESNSIGMTPIYYSMVHAQEGDEKINIDVIKHLIKVHNVDLLPADDQQSVLLHYFLRATNCDLELLQLLHKNDQLEQYINQPGDYSATPIQIAIEYRPFEIFTFLITHKAEIIVDDDLLENAARHNNDERVLDYCLDIYQNTVETPSISFMEKLIEASVLNSDYTTTQMLITRRKVDPRPNKKFNLINSIISKGLSATNCHKVFQYLLQLGHYDLNIQAPHDSFLGQALRYPNSFNIDDIKMMIKYGAKIDFKPKKSKETMLNIAIEGGSIEIIDYLISIGCTYDSKDDTNILCSIDKYTNFYQVLHHLLYKYPKMRPFIEIMKNEGSFYEELIEFPEMEPLLCVLAHKPNIEITNQNGLTPLLLASSIPEGNFKAAKILIQYSNCNIYHQDEEQRNLFHCAILENDDDNNVANFIQYVIQHRFIQDGGNSEGC